MGSPYTSVSATGYNANPPPDDGSATESNRITWAKIKTKLADVIKTLADAINSNVVDAFGKVAGGITTTSISYQIVSTDQGKTIVATTAGITITSPDATDVGAPFKGKILNKTTGNVIFDGSGSQTIDGVASITIPAGCGIDYDTDGTNWFTGGQNFTNSQIAPVPGGFKNLSIKVASNTTVTVAADYVVATNGAGKFQTTAVSSTINMGTSAVVDALDIGTIAIDSWYYIWVIVQSDGTTKCVASLQSTANATFLSNLAAIASGAYTYYARIGAVLTIHASATLYGTWQFGRKAQYVVGLAQTTVPPSMAAGSSGSATDATISYTSLSTSAFVPSTASRIELILMNFAGNGTSVVAPNSSFGGFDSTTKQPPLSLNTTVSISISGGFLLESTNIYYAMNTANSRLCCLGWEDNL